MEIVLVGPTATTGPFERVVLVEIDLLNVPPSITINPSDAIEYVAPAKTSPFTNAVEAALDANVVVHIIDTML